MVTYDTSTTWDHESFDAQCPADISEDEPITKQNADILAAIVLPDDGDDDGAPCDQGDDQQRENWIRSEPKWKDRIGQGWVPHRLLGAGGYGLAGLWRYDGDAANQWEKYMEFIVVKQALLHRGSGLREEVIYFQTFICFLELLYCCGYTRRLIC